MALAQRIAVDRGSVSLRSSGPECWGSGRPGEALPVRRSPVVQRVTFASMRAVGLTGGVHELPRLEVQAERAELEVRRHLEQQVIRVVRDPDLRSTILREDPLGLD